MADPKEILLWFWESVCTELEELLKFKYQTLSRATARGALYSPSFSSGPEMVCASWTARSISDSWVWSTCRLSAVSLLLYPAPSILSCIFHRDPSYHHNEPFESSSKIFVQVGLVLLMVELFKWSIQVISGVVDLRISAVIHLKNSVIIDGCYHTSRLEN